MGRPGTGIMVRDYLLKERVAPVMQIWREGIVEPCKELGFNYPCWHDFGNYFSKLKRLGLVQFDHREDAPDITGEPVGGRVRNFYRLDMERVNDPAWRNPLKALYPELFR
jgi:hypothetical protein